MKKTFRILICLLLLLLIGVNIYLERLFLLAKQENDDLHLEVNNINEKINEADKQTESLNDTYNDLTNKNSDLVLEYSNWQHHLEKLEKVMDY